jgi:hypothetical protein
MLSSEFYFVLLYYYLAGLLEISICSKDFLFCPLVDTEKVGSFLLTHVWYIESPILFIYLFPFDMVIKAVHYSIYFIIVR